MTTRAHPMTTITLPFAPGDIATDCGYPDGFTARSRVSDPETSHQAGASISADTLRASQAAVIRAFWSENGKLTDEQLATSYAVFVRLFPGSFPLQSPSGLRTRRKELVDTGYLADSGERGETASGRKTIRWTLTERGRTAEL